MTITLSPLIILFGAELLLLLIALAIYMTISRQRYKKLYKKLLSVQDKSLAVDIITDKPEVKAVQKLEEPIKETEAEVVKEKVPTETPAISDDLEISAGPQDTSDEASTDKPDEEGTPEEPAGVQKLKKIVDFQKEKIVNLMCYKDILESAQKKLTSIHTDYEDLAQRFTSLSEAMGSNKEYELALEMFGENTAELKDFIDALQHENTTLLEKFNTWEEQLKGLWQESEEIATSEDIEAFAAEKNELLEKIKEFEEKFKEKSKQLEEAQAQYEDLEKEYLVLYKQQQGTTKA